MNLAEMREGHLETGELISYMQPGGGGGGSGILSFFLLHGIQKG